MNERKSCEIKLPLFSHQKQQHVMMIITRLCWIFFSLSRSLNIMENFCAVRKKEKKEIDG
jgi:hypothetical protein